MNYCKTNKPKAEQDRPAHDMLPTTNAMVPKQPNKTKDDLANLDEAIWESLYQKFPVK